MRFLARVLAALAGFLAFDLALVALLGAGGANGGFFSDWLDVLAHFAPIWLGMAVAAGALSLAAPKGKWRAATRGMAAGAAVLAMVLIAPELWARPSGLKITPPSGTFVKLIQLNSWGRLNTDREATIDWLYAQRADVIVLEEVNKPIREALKRRGGYHLTCEWSSMCEVLILSRQKPIETGVPQLTLGHKFPVARATFAAPGGPFTVIGAHYTWPVPPGHQQQQGERLAALIAQFPRERLIVAGDFNSTPWSYSRRREDRAFGLERRTRALFSWPRALGRIEIAAPFLAIDQVYAGRDVVDWEIKRGPALGSDHYPVIATFVLLRSASKPAR